MPMGGKILLFFVLVSLSAQSQDIGPNVLFSKVIGDNIKTYTLKSQQAYADGDYEKAKFLFDSLINHVINGSYLDNFKVRKLSGRTIHFDYFKKPIFLLTYASWCTPGVGEIPALNDIANKHYKEIDFVILFWDSKENLKKIAREYNNKITILYVDEKENKSDHIVETLKHSLGFPTFFFIDESKMILDVRRSVLNQFNDKFTISFNLNYNAFLNGISLLKNTSFEDSGLTLKE